MGRKAGSQCHVHSSGGLLFAVRLASLLPSQERASHQATHLPPLHVKVQKSSQLFFPIFFSSLFSISLSTSLFAFLYSPHLCPILFNSLSHSLPSLHLPLLPLSLHYVSRSLSRRCLVPLSVVDFFSLSGPPSLFLSFLFSLFLLSLLFSLFLLSLLLKSVNIVTLL